jgi:HAE1 family hydrophobic/amphiphilic exporter-1
VGGLLFSQLITLYITPVVYTYLDAFQQRLARRKAKEPRELREPGRGDATAAEAPG